MKKIRVLHVIKTLALGGAETNLLNLVMAMDPKRVETHVAYSWGGEIESRFKEKGVRLFKYAASSHRIKSLATAGIVLKLAAYMVRHRIQVVHTHVFNAHVWAGLAARLTGRKVVEHVHDFRFINALERRQGGCVIDQFQYVDKIKGLSDAVIVLTEKNKKFTIENHLHAPEDVWRVRNGISLHASAGQVRELEAAASARLAGRKIFLTPARMSAEKNMDLLFQVVPAVVAACPEALFWVAGDGPLLATYQKRVVNEGLQDHLVFLGFRPNIRQLLLKAYAMVLPSFLELHPVSILEALSMKVPVLVSKDVGCNSEVFTDGHDALLLDPRRRSDWIRAIIALIRDPVRAAEIGENGYQLCRCQFDIRDTASQIERIYEKLISK